MIEILAGNLDKAVIDLNLTATKTYESKTKHYNYEETYQVWELTEEDFAKLCNIVSENWKSE